MIEILSRNTDMTRIPLKKILESAFCRDVNYFRLNNRRCLCLLTDKSLFLPESGLSERLIADFSDSGETKICAVYGGAIHSVGELIQSYAKLSGTIEVCFFTENSIVLPADSGNLSEYEKNPPIDAVTDRIAFRFIQRTTTRCFPI